MLRFQEPLTRFRIHQKQFVAPRTVLERDRRQTSRQPREDAPEGKRWEYSLETKDGAIYEDGTFFEAGQLKAAKE